jgi:hypothetical protein
MLKEELLAFRSRPTMAAHSRHNERFQAQGGTFPDNSLDDTIDAGNAAGTGGNSDRLAWFDAVPEG